MKPIFISFIGIALLCLSNSCQRKNANQGTILTSSESKDAQGNIVLLGKSTKERLTRDPFNSWFTSNYNDYRIDTAIADQLKPMIGNKKLVIFMGTWCGDSRREVPRIYKLLDYCGVPASQVQLITVSSDDSLYKQSPGHEEKGLSIHRVPDLLVYDGKTEMGRVVESPVISWEKDLLTILKKQEYSSRYKGVPFLLNLFETHSYNDIEARMENIKNDLHPLLFHPAELASYGKVLIASHEAEKAVIVLKLNSMLYPSAGSFNSLGDAYIYAGNKKYAIENYRKAASMEKTP